MQLTSPAAEELGFVHRVPEKEPGLDQVLLRDLQRVDRAGRLPEVVQPRRYLLEHESERGDGLRPGVTQVRHVVLDDGKPGPLAAYLEVEHATRPRRMGEARPLTEEPAHLHLRAGARFELAQEFEDETIAEHHRGVGLFQPAGPERLLGDLVAEGATPHHRLGADRHVSAPDLAPACRQLDQCGREGRVESRVVEQAGLAGRGYLCDHRSRRLEANPIGVDSGGE